MSKQIKKKEDTGLTVVDAPTGFEDVEMDDLIIPRLKLLQSLSLGVVSGDGKPGQFQNSVTEEVFDSPVEIVPLSFKKSAVYLVPGEGLKCRSDDGITSINNDKCEDCPFGEYWKVFKENKPPKCCGTYDYVVVTKDSITDDIPNVSLFTFMKTGYKLGRKLISMARLGGKYLYSKSYSIGSTPEKGDMGPYQGITIKPSGNLNADELNACAELAKTFTAKAVTTTHPIEDEVAKSSPDEGEDI